MAVARWWLASSAALVIALAGPVLPARAQAPALLGLAPLVVLAPRCGVRPPEWGQRLDVALADALADEGSADAAALAEAELAAMRRWQAAPIATCAKWRAERATNGSLTRADRLLAPE